MRILVVTQDYPPPTTGGYGVMAADVCGRLVSLGHDVRVLTAEASTSQETTPAGVRVRRALSTYYENGECVYPPLEQAAGIEGHNLAVLENSLREQPDVISFWHMGAMSLNMITRAAQLGFPLVFVVGDDWLVYGTWADGWQRRFVEDPETATEVARQTGLPTRPPNVFALGHVCFVSEYTRSRALAAEHGTTGRTSVVPPGLRSPFFVPRTSFEWNDQLLWVGRVIESKGILTALRALAELPNEMRLRVLGLGGGDFLPAVHREIDRLGLAKRVTFAARTRDQLPAEYVRACVTLFTSEIEHEAFGLVALEAMAGGSVVVSSGVGGSAEFCRDEVNCLRYPAGDSKALAGRIDRLRRESALRISLGCAAIETAAGYTLEGQVAALEQLFVAERQRKDRS